MLRAGILYRLKDFLITINSRANSTADIVHSFPNYRGVPILDLLNTAEIGGWICCQPDGVIK